MPVAGQQSVFVFGGVARGLPMSQLEVLDLVTHTWSAPMILGQVRYYI